MTTPSRKPTRRRRGGRRRKPREASPPPEPIAPEPEPAPVETAPEPALEATSALLPLAEPELVFAGRAAARPPEPERPLPTTRRAIFFDVENTSRVQHIARVIDHLAVDRLGRRTDFIAVGNWRVIGHDTARLLAGHGAQLLHSAPAVGVKDWSDLRIAVAAGVWLGTARPGDVLEIISDDRAFDAVGDVATSLGLTFRRLSYRRLTGVPTPAPLAPVEEPAPPPYQEPRGDSRGDSRGGRRRRGRRGGHRREMPPAHVAPAPPPPQVARPSAGAEEPHTAPHDELLGVARDLIQRSSSRMVTLDALANALKARGFSRPPGSPRLITRLRRLRELQVSRAGQITLVDADAPDASPTEPAEPAVSHAQEPEEDNEPTPGNEWPPVRQSSAPAHREREPRAPAYREPRPMTYEDRRAAVDAAQYGGAPNPPLSDEPEQGDGPQADGSQGDGAQGEGSQGEGSQGEGAPRRRRSRRGGRRRRRHGAPAG